MKRPLDIGDIGSAVRGLGPSLKPETERMSARKTFVFCELRFSGENCSRSACRGDVTRFVGMTACQWSEFRWDFRGEKKTNLLGKYSRSLFHHRSFGHSSARVSDTGTATGVGEIRPPLSQRISFSGNGWWWCVTLCVQSSVAHRKSLTLFFVQSCSLL